MSINNFLLLFFHRNKIINKTFFFYLNSKLSEFFLIILISIKLEYCWQVQIWNGSSPLKTIASPSVLQSIGQIERLNPDSLSYMPMWKWKSLRNRNIFPNNVHLGHSQWWEIYNFFLFLTDYPPYLNQAAFLLDFPVYLNPFDELFPWLDDKLTCTLISEKLVKKMAKPDTKNRARGLQASTFCDHLSSNTAHLDVFQDRFQRSHLFLYTSRNI